MRRRFSGRRPVKPGRFNAWGTVVALYLLVTGVTGLELLGTSSRVQEMFNGAALLVAVTFAPRRAGAGRLTQMKEVLFDSS